MCPWVSSEPTAFVAVTVSALKGQPRPHSPPVSSSLTLVKLFPAWRLGEFLLWKRRCQEEGLGTFRISTQVIRIILLALGSPQSNSAGHTLRALWPEKGTQAAFRKGLDRVHGDGNSFFPDSWYSSVMPLWRTQRMLCLDFMPKISQVPLQVKQLDAGGGTLGFLFLALCT